MTLRTHRRPGRSILSVLLLATTALTGAGAAHAQETAASEEGGLGDIIVLAQKRRENLQDVPVSVLAYGEERLEELNVSDFADYVKLLPSISFQASGPGFNNVYMRGVASGGDGNHSASLPSVGIYLDEQPITTIQGALDIHVYDVASVEAYAGPQGTLYGASSQAGTLRILTNKPELGVLKGAFGAEANVIDGGGPGYVGEGFINVPVGEKAAVRLVGWYKSEGGYIDNVPGTLTYATSGATIDNSGFTEDDYNTAETYGARAALKIDLNESWTVTPQVIGQITETEGSYAYDPEKGDRNVSRFYPESSSDRWVQAALTIEGKISKLDFVYAGSFLKRDDETQSDYSDYSFFYDTLAGYGAYWYDESGTPLDNPSQYIQGKDKYERQTHEIRVSSPDDWRLRFVAGLFYQTQDHFIEQRYRIDNLASTLEVTGFPDTLWLTEQKRTDTDYAAFGELSFDITDKLTATGGLRVFKAENALLGFFGFSSGYSSRTGEAACFAPPSVDDEPCTNVDKSTEDEDYTYKANLTYKLTEDAMVYGTISTGYRPGGINRRATLPAYQPDFLTNYELGWKTSWANNRVRFNGAAFLEQWDDFQFSILGANGLTEIKNAAQAEMIGLEASFAWAPTDAWTFTAAGAYIKSELTENYCGFTDDAGNPITECADPLAPEGTELPVTPELNLNATVRYMFDMAGLKAHMQAAGFYVGDRWADLRLIEREILGRMEAYQSADLSAGLTGDVWSMEVFMTNAFDERGETNRSAACAEQVCSRVYVNTIQPRTLGIKFGQKF